MSRLARIPTKLVSGQKYKNEQGVSAVRDGIKASSDPAPGSLPPKPEWLRMRISDSPKSKAVKKIVAENNLSTVCEEAKCPNLSECWAHGTATIMILGYICTRACRFCSVDTGNPKGYLDHNEPKNTANAVDKMGLKYVVLTSVDRDDLIDGGAEHYAQTIKLIKNNSALVKVEALAPDFQGKIPALHTLLDSGLDVFAQNLETVKRLTHPVRDPRAGYEQTLEVLKAAKEYKPNIYTKSSLMLGMGETKQEILQAMQDLLSHKVDILTLGQYLQPTRNHYPVDRYVTPDEFDFYRSEGLKMGFFEVASGPFVRSSYRADRVFSKDNLGL
jgi:lipoic acid synthetase